MSRGQERHFAYSYWAVRGGTATQLLPLLLIFLLHVNVGVLALRKIELQRKALALEDADHPTNIIFPQIIPLLQARGKIDGNDVLPWCSIEVDKENSAAISIDDYDMPLFPHPQAQADASASAKIPKWEDLILKNADPSLIIPTRSEDYLACGGIGRMFKLSDESTSIALKHVAIELDDWGTMHVDELFGDERTIRTITHRNPTLALDVAVTLAVGEAGACSFQENLLHLFRGVGTGRREVMPALREAYVALDISSRMKNQGKQATQCCVNTHSVHVAFSRTPWKRQDEAAYLYHIHFIYAMDLMEGGDLLRFAHLEDRPAHIQWQTLVGVFFQDVVQAVRQMHKLDWSHGDIKPENLLLTVAFDSTRLTTRDQRPRLRLADFGAALPIGVERTPKDGGTDRFADPALLFGNSVNAIEADCWSVGVTLYSTGSCALGVKNMDLSDSDLRSRCCSWFNNNSEDGFFNWWYYRQNPPAPPPFAFVGLPPRLNCRAGAFECFMAALYMHAFNMEPEKRSLEKLGESLAAIAAKDYAAEVLQLPPPVTEAQEQQPPQPGSATKLQRSVSAPATLRLTTRSTAADDSASSVIDDDDPSSAVEGIPRMSEYHQETKEIAFIQGQEDASTSSGGKDTDNDKKTRKGKLRKIKQHDFSAFLELAGFERATESVDATSESVEAAAEGVDADTAETGETAFGFATQEKAEHDKGQPSAQSKYAESRSGNETGTMEL